jgi:hypothetical protein
MRARQRAHRGGPDAAAQRHDPRSDDVADQELLLEGDALVEAEASASADVPASGSIALYRALSQVRLGSMAWSGAVEHGLLQAAIECAPMRPVDSRGLPGWLQTAASIAVHAETPEGSALFTLLSADDIALLDGIGPRLARDVALGLARAAAMPSSIVGSDAATAEAAGPALVAYRRTALVFAWQTALDGVPSADVVRDRDAAAIELISTLRAVLGEV